MPSEIGPDDYTFMFKYKIPIQDTTLNNQQSLQQWPASFHMKRDIKDKGELKLRVKYKLIAKIIKIGG